MTYVQRGNKYNPLTIIRSLLKYFLITSGLNFIEKAQKEKAIIHPELQTDLDRLTKKNIPVDVVFEQGVDVLGVK